MFHIFVLEYCILIIEVQGNAPVKFARHLPTRQPLQETTWSDFDPSAL